MKIMNIIDNNLNVINEEIRWYLSSQIIWIGKEKDYKEIENTKKNSYGSFDWLWSDVDTILFSKDNLEFSGAVIKLAEPINVIKTKSLNNQFEEKNGSIQLRDKKNFSSKLSHVTEYYTSEDKLVSYSEKWDKLKEVVLVNMTKNFSFVLQNDELVGFVLANASNHIISDNIYKVEDRGINKPDFAQKLSLFLELVKMMESEMPELDESELKKSFQKIYEEILNYKGTNYIALRDTIFNVMDYMD